MFLLLLGGVIALAAAARSTWSPCGLSMLSQITPLAEAGRGQKFARTAGWFIAGAALGGATLGGGIAAAAFAWRGAGIGHRVAITVVVCGGLVSAAVDANVLGFGPPFLKRQVNDAWLSEYRSWVYGIGFGWQIGAGVTTYVMTAAVPFMILLGALTAKPWAALAIGALFGLARGLAVLLGSNLRTPDALLAFHRRFDAWAAPVRETVIALELGVAVLAAWTVAPRLVAVGVSLAAVALLSAPRRVRNAPTRRTSWVRATAGATRARRPG